MTHTTLPPCFAGAMALLFAVVGLGCVPDEPDTLDGGTSGGVDGGAFDAGIVVDGGSADGGLVDGGRVDGGSADGGVADAGASAIDETCVADGCVRDVLDVGTYTREDIQAAVTETVVVDNGYRVRWVRFVTNGREARAVLTIPIGDAPDRGFDVVVNAPGTVGLADACAIAFSVAGAGLAGAFGARGFIGVSLDYPGIGTDGEHPYLVAEVEGDAVLHAAMAALIAVEEEGISASGRVALTGLSQGGHAALSAARRHAEGTSAVDVRAVAVAGPASVWLEQWSASAAAAGPHIVYHALLAQAWATTYDHAGPSIWEPSFAGLVPDVFETRCLVDVEGATLGAPRDQGGLGENPSLIFSPAFLSAFAGADPTAIEAAGFGFLAEGFAANRLGPWEQTAPILIMQGEADAVVLASHVTALVDDLRQGGMTIDYVLVPNGGHTDVAFGFLAVPQLGMEEALTWIREQLDAP